MGKIKLLSPELINLIAAGEVVERPASVVKELIENSIDAGADRVIINIEEGGRKKIEVIDNGSGMEEEDARLALTQHATSKLATKDDLSNIHTLGFRGEALASISSVSTIEIDTKYRGSEAVKLLADKDGIKKKSSSRSDVGTTITVKDLFQNTPARLKFLRSQETEFGHIQDLVNSLGLANLNVHLELYHNSKLVLRLPKAKDISERIFSIWNRSVAENLYIQGVKKPGYKLFIAAGKPDIGRKDRKLQYLFVNKRLITDRLLQKAILESYKGYLHRDLYPVYFIFLEIDPKLVDVNVHPRKQEVRFNNTQEVYSFVFNGLRTLIDQSTKDDLVSRIKEGRNEEGSFRSSSNGNIDTSWAREAKGVAHNNFRPNVRSKERNINYSLDFTKELLKDQPSFATGGFTEPRAEGVSLEPSITEPNNSKPFQLFFTYIVYEHKESVVFVDQHAAAEKILYEKLKNSHDGTRSAALLVPIVLELLPGEKQKVLARKELFSGFGIEVEDFGGDSIQINSLPELTPTLRIKDFIEELLEKEDEEKIGKLSHDAHIAVATLACHGAIRAGQRLSEVEMRQILEDLAQCKDPYNCPHGRPVSWVLSKSDIEKEFVRKL